VGRLRAPARVRAFWRRLLYWRFRLFQSHRHGHLVLERVDGLPLVVLPDVFNPCLFRSGEFLARWTTRLVAPGDAVLDLGTGSGVGAIFAARRAAAVVAVDVNPAAARCARINCLLHQIEDRVDVRQGDLFSVVAGQRFDVVLFNPPYYRGTPRNALEEAFRSDDIIERFAAGLDDVLAPDGRAVLVISTDADPTRVLSALERHGFRADTLEQKDLINEIVLVWLVRRAERGGV
jgi:release factor glutamine methyltransferase